jgi:hypothetical protein
MYDTQQDAHCEEISLFRNPFGIGNMYVNNFFMLRIVDTMTSKNKDLSSWDILYVYMCIYKNWI